MFRRFVDNYIQRHQNRVNQILHVFGVPLTFVGTPVCLAAETAWYWPVLCFVGGYLLQFAGHAVEGNDAGEVVLIKKLLGMPYTEFGPARNASSDSD